MICTKCQKERPINFFRKRKGKRRERVCRACKLSRTCQLRRWHRDGRECARCGEVKPCPSEITDIDRTGAGVCKACIAAKAKVRGTAWSRHKRETDAEWRARQIAAARRWQAKNPDQVRLNNLKRYQRVRADPVRHERLKGDARMRYRLRMERAGTPSRPVSVDAYIDRYGKGYGKTSTVPVEPLLTILREALETIDERSLADVSGVSVRRMYDLLHGRTKGVSVVNADKLCVYLGVPFSLLYDEAEWRT